MQKLEPGVMIEGRPRGHAPLQARRRPGKRQRAVLSRATRYSLGHLHFIGLGGLAKDEHEAARLFKLAAAELARGQLDRLASGATATVGFACAQLLVLRQLTRLRAGG